MEIFPVGLGQDLNVLNICRSRSVQGGAGGGGGGLGKSPGTLQSVTELDEISPMQRRFLKDIDNF